MDKMDTTIPGTAPIVKKSYISTTKDLMIKHKKSCFTICAILLVIAFLLIIWAYNCPDAFVAAYVPAMISSGSKSSRKSSDGKSSDSKIEGWSKDDYMKSVNKFNAIASSA